MTARLPHPYTLADAEAFIAAATDPLAKDASVFAIDAECEGLIGVVAIWRNEDDRPELGYWIGKPYWGQGYATEAVRALLKQAKADGRKVIYAGHFADNPASGGVLIKAGFLYTAEVRPEPCAARGAPVMSRRMVWLA